MAPKKKKDTRPSYVDRNVRQVLTPEDYGIDPSRIAKPAEAATSDLKLYGTNVVGSGVNTSTLTGPDGKPITAPGAVLKDPAKPLASANFLTPDEQQQARQAQETAQKVQQEIASAEPPEQSWFANLFDTSDTFDENGNFKSGDLGFLGGEALWDGFFRGLQWGMDRVNQFTVAGLSALPGGTRTLTFDEANDVSVGQMLVANAGVSAGRVRRGEANFGDALALAFGVIPGIGAAVAAINDPDTPIQQAGFDITSEKDREVFKNGAERFFSGFGDFGFAFADPTLLVGWGAKIGRLRYVDQLIDSPEKMQASVNRVVEGQRVLQNQLDTRFGTEAVRNNPTVNIERSFTDLEDFDVSKLDISTEAMFLYNAVKQNKFGEKVTKFEEIYNHKVIQRAANRDALATALYNANTYEEASLVFRHAIGDSTALPELMQKRPTVLAALIDGEREQLRNIIISDPAAQAKKIAEYEAKVSRYDRDLDFLRSTTDDPRLQDKIDFVITKRNEAYDDWLTVASGDIPRRDLRLDDALTSMSIDELRRYDLNLDATIRAAAQAGGSLRQTTKGFSRANSFGRAIEKSRQKRARAQYETETTRGAKLWQSTDFDYLNTIGGRGKRLLRVWRYMGAEAPSGVIRIAGVGGQESAREVRAMLNSIRIYGGKGKEVIGPDGQARIVGGSLQKEKYLTEYVNAVTRGGVQGQEDAATALAKLERNIEADLADFYGINAENLSGPIMKRINAARAELKESIQNRGYWTEKDPVTNEIITHKAPYLESQMEGSVIAAPWRDIEKAIIRDGKRGSVLKETAERWTVASYSTFQDLWRPAVLLRLGYTQRNVAEGLFRSAAFQFSLAPLGLAARQFGLSSGNVARRARYGAEGTRGAVGAAIAAARREGATFEQMPAKFQKWRNTQVQAVDEQINQNSYIIDMTLRDLATDSAEWKAKEQARIADRIKSLSAEKERLIEKVPSGMTRDQADAAIRRIESIIGDSERRLAIIDDVTPTNAGGLSDDMLPVADNLIYFDEQVMPMLYAQQEILMNPRSAAVMFREQTLAKRRVSQGQANVTDPKTLQSVFMDYMNRGAFDPTDSYTNIALANLSADATTRQTMALRMNTAQALLRKEVTKNYVSVKPGDKGYWEGLATTLNQWKNSDVGAMIIRDIAEGIKTDDDIALGIASFLRNTERGREIARFVTNANQDILPQGQKFTEYAQRVGSAHAAALKAAVPEREAADRAKDAIRQAEDDVAFAKQKLKEDQKVNKSRKTLIGPDGKQIRNPEAYIQKRRDAYIKAEKKYEEKVEKLSAVPEQAGTGIAPLLSPEDALAYGIKMIQRYRSLTADSRQLQTELFLRRSLTTGDQNPLGKFANDLSEYLGANARDEFGNPYNLVPVIGNASTELGSVGAMQFIKNISDRAFRLLGTIPEDTFVRAPFYGRRFQATYDELVKNALDQAGDAKTLTLNQVNAIRQAAHYRALKDTKDWLYTIDRRTLLGQYGEAIFPFISASQNGVTAVGRMIWNDPRIAAVMIMIWNAPTRAGLEDEEGRMHFTMPLEWVPEGIRDALGLDAMLDITFSKDQFNLIAPPTGFGGGLPVPVPGPIVAVPFSEMMKRGLLGVTPETPELLRSIFGNQFADEVWDFTKGYVYGSGDDLVGMSTQPFSIDKVLPAWGQKALQWMQGEGSSSAFTSWYDKIYQSEQLKWAQGYRDEPPTPDEIRDKTRNFYLLRMAMNLFAFTPPGFTSDITPIVEASQKIYDSAPTPEAADQMIYEKFGPVVQQILDIRTTKNVAGLSATDESLRLAKNHADLIGAVAPSLAENGTLNVIGLLSSGSKGEYDPSFSAAQQLATIPNTNETFRQVLNPAQAAIDSQISAGWAQYLRGNDMIMAKLAERGLKSIRASGAEDLLALKKQLVETMRQDPRFSAWYGDYINGASSRTMDSVMLLNTALNDQKWRDAHKDDPIWGFGGAADQYAYYRQQTVEALDNATSSEQRKQIKNQWVAFRADLAMRYPDWAAKQERYFSGDEDPDAPQIVFVSDVQPLDAESVMAQKQAMEVNGFSTEYGWQ